MPALLVYIVAPLSLQAFEVEAAPELPAQQVIDALCRTLSTEQKVLDECRALGSSGDGEGAGPGITDTWQHWCTGASAMLLRIRTAHGAAEQASAAGQLGAGGQMSAAGPVVDRELTSPIPRAVQAPGPPAPGAPTVLEASAGPDSGFAIALPTGDWSLARSDSADLPLMDPFLSRTPIRLHNAPSGITVEAPDGRAGTIPFNGSAASSVVIGSTRLTVVPGPAHGPGPGVHLEQPQPAAVEAPRPPSWLHAVVPVGIGVVLALVTGMWWFLLFSFSGPLTAALSWWWEKRRWARESGQAQQRHRAAMRDFSAELRARLAGAHSAAAAAPRRRGTAVVGCGAVAAAVRITGAAHEREEQTAGEWFGDAVHPLLQASPIVLPFAESALNVNGLADIVCDIVRTVVAAALADGIPVRIEPPADDDEALARLLPELLAADVEIGRTPLSAGGAGIVVVLKVHGDQAHAEVRSAAHSLGTDSAHSGRAAQRWEIQCPRADSSATLLVHPVIEPVEWGSPVSGALELRRLRTERFLVLNSRWRRPAAHTSDSSDLAVLLDEATRAPVLPRGVPLGSGTWVDLFTDGPHALVAGTTGSGKSVLLQTWVLALAALHSPEQLRFVLIDFKGGAALAPFADLPHVDGIVDNLTPYSALRALRSLRAEILRREALLAGAGCADIEEYTARGCRPRIPRAVVVIDEFQALLQDSPSGVETVESLTALGRSLGVHLILATQRPSGVVTARMRANINLRIALRVRDDADSREVLDVDDAARIDAALPGAGLLSAGGPPQPFRASLPRLSLADDALNTSDRQVRWRSLRDGATGSVELPPVPVDPPDDRRPEAWSLPAVIRTACAQAESAEPPVHRIVLPPLPTAVQGPGAAQTAAGAQAATEAAICAEAQGALGFLGLIDFPDEGRTADWHLDPDREGSVIITGGSGRGMSTAIRLFAAASLELGDMVLLLSGEQSETDRSEVKKADNDQSGSSRAEASDSAPVLADMETPRLIRAVHSEPWVLEYVLGLLDRADCGRLTVCIDDFDALRARIEGSRQLSRLDQLLTRTDRLRFVLTAHRRILHSPVAAAAPTRIVFPPADAHDTVHFGLPSRRFEGDWPPGRAVLIGPASGPTGTAGADVQLSLPPTSRAAAAPAHSGSAASAAPRTLPGTHGTISADQPWSRPRPRTHTALTSAALPRAQGARPDPAAAHPHPSSTHVRLGAGPLGEAVLWHPDDDGPVLTVRAPAGLLPSLFRALSWASAPSVEWVPAAHSAQPSAVEHALDARACVLGVPLHHTAGYGSALQKAAVLGPSLLIGVRTEAELGELGFRGLPVIPPIPFSGHHTSGAETGEPALRGWFVTPASAVPVEIVLPTEQQEPSLHQTADAPHDPRDQTESHHQQNPGDQSRPSVT